MKEFAKILMERNIPFNYCGDYLIIRCLDNYTLTKAIKCGLQYVESTDYNKLKLFFKD